MTQEKLKITKYFKTKPRDGKPSPLVAIISIQFTIPGRGPYYINKIKLFRGNNGQTWVKFPDEEYLKDGEKKYLPYCGFIERKAQDQIQKEIMDAIEEYYLHGVNSLVEKPPVQDDFPF